MPEPEEETAQNLWENALDPAPLYQLNTVLQADTILCMDEVQQRLNLRDGSEKFWMRALVRAFFSQVEGNLYQMRQIVLRAGDASLIDLTAEEQLLLRDLGCELDETGTPRTRPVFQKTERVLRFVYRLFCRVYGLSRELDCSDNGWREFRLSLLVRHRLTHPKNASDLSVTLDEAQTLGRASAWLFRVIGELMSAVAVQLQTIEIQEHLTARALSHIQERKARQIGL